MIRRMLWGLLPLAVLGLGASAFAADFTQPQRSPTFIQSARRQDKEVARFLGRQVPGGTQFNHIGSFQVLVHRSGAQRQLTLVPVSRLAYANADTLRNTARDHSVVVGALKLTYAHTNPEVSIQPGTLLMIYDGLRVHLRDVHGQELASFDATLQPAPQESQIDEELGKIDTANASLANVLPDGTLQVYLQLVSGTGKLLTGTRGTGANVGLLKVLLEFKVPGLVADDDSPLTQLVTPKAEDKKVKPAKVFGR